MEGRVFERVFGQMCRNYDSTRRAAAAFFVLLNIKLLKMGEHNIGPGSNQHMSELHWGSLLEAIQDCDEF